MIGLFNFPLRQQPDGTIVSSGPIAESGGISVYTDFTTKPDGPIQSTHDELGLGIRTFYPPLLAPVTLVVSSGRLKSSVENSGQTVCYTETDLNGQASVIGADIAFKNNGGNQGTIALCLWGDSSLVDTFNQGRIPKTGCHFIIGYSQMQYQIWDDNGSGGTTLVTLATINCPILPRDGSLTRVQISFDGDSATIELPEYNFSKTVTDSRIRTLGRRYACWETLQQNNTIDQPQFGRIWASAYRGADRAIKSVADAASKSKIGAIASALDADYTLTLASTETDSALRVEFTVPASGKVLVEYSALLAQTAASGACIIEFRATDSGGGNVITKAVQVSNSIVTQQMSARAIMTGLTAGAKRFIRVHAYLTGSAAAAIKRSTAGGLIPVLTVSPLP